MLMNINPGLLCLWARGNKWIYKYIRLQISPSYSACRKECGTAVFVHNMNPVLLFHWCRVWGIIFHLQSTGTQRCGSVSACSMTANKPGWWGLMIYTVLESQTNFFSFFWGGWGGILPDWFMFIHECLYPVKLQHWSQNNQPEVREADLLAQEITVESLSDIFLFCLCPDNQKVNRK